MPYLSNRGLWGKREILQRGRGSLGNVSPNAGIPYISGIPPPSIRYAVFIATLGQGVSGEHDVGRLCSAKIGRAIADDRHLEVGKSGLFSPNKGPFAAEASIARVGLGIGEDFDFAGIRDHAIVDRRNGVQAQLHQHGVDVYIQSLGHNGDSTASHEWSDERQEIVSNRYLCKTSVKIGMIDIHKGEVAVEII